MSVARRIADGGEEVLLLLGTAILCEIDLPREGAVVSATLSGSEAFSARATRCIEANVVVCHSMLSLAAHEAHITPAVCGARVHLVRTRKPGQSFRDLNRIYSVVTSSVHCERSIESALEKALLDLTLVRAVRVAGARPAGSMGHRR